MSVNKTRVLFVCLGNICRSPLAEFIVRSVAQRAGENRFEFASAGTGDWHVGLGADHRACSTAQAHQLDMSSHRAQQLIAANVPEWDWFIAMDQANYQDILAMGAPAERVLLMRQFEQSDTTLDVPDPYYGGPDGFEHAYTLLEENAGKLIAYLQSQT